MDALAGEVVTVVEGFDFGGFGQRALEGQPVSVADVRLLTQGHQLRRWSGGYQQVGVEFFPAVARVNGVGLKDEPEGVCQPFGRGCDDAVYAY